MSSVKARFGNVMAWLAFTSFLLGVLPSAVIISGAMWEEHIQPQPTFSDIDCREIETTDGSGLDCRASIIYVLAEYEGTQTLGWDIVRWRAENSARARLATLTDYVHFFSSDTAIDDFLSITVVLGGFWLPILVLNYIFYGSARFLPWKKLVASDQTPSS